ncbi:hypothetical protein [Tropicimonas isoalkanivorans]|uniref:Uncharacterized protein n=1 Tax=Tropicimonas isoalkanivorans TaxID=441112 RepID=A0A1I1DLI7_9RHOB|nr:hypothetical protein [Tropicimonas isoalkanivorans]SFB75296.1 hypothetical protein SAMN04488094_101296 [Tropicimonas isoalkanivorans]
MKILRTCLTAGLVLCLPVALGGQGWVDFSDLGAAVAKQGGNGGGKGNGGSNGGGKGNSGGGKGNSDSKGNSGGSKGNNGNKGNSDNAKSSKGGSSVDKGSRTATRSDGGKSSNGKGPGAFFRSIGNAFNPKSSQSNKPAATARTTTTKAVKSKPVKSAKTTAPARTTTVKTSPKPAARPATAAAAATTLAMAHPSELKSLNSLKRDLNGVMNSKDPKMEPFREYIQASAERETAMQSLIDAEKALAESSDVYAGYVDELGLDPKLELAEEQLATRAAELAALEPDPDTPEWDAWNADMQEVLDAQKALDQVAADTKLRNDSELALTDATLATNSTALRQAIADSYYATGQGPMTEADVSPEVEAWVSQQLGVGDDDGLIDEYMARSGIAPAEVDDIDVDEPEIGELDDGIDPTAGDDTEVTGDDGLETDPGDGTYVEDETDPAPIDDGTDVADEDGLDPDVGDGTGAEDGDDGELVDGDGTEITDGDSSGDDEVIPAEDLASADDELIVE